jgi:hypothetical protein
MADEIKGEIKQKIREAAVEHTTGASISSGSVDKVMTTKRNISFTSGAFFGYSLAAKELEEMKEEIESWKESKESWEHISEEKDKEIERLKDLLKSLRHCGVASCKSCNADWKQFKIEYQL